MGRIILSGDFVMSGNLRMDTKDDRVFLRWQIGKPHGTGFPLDPYSRRIDNLIRFRHNTSFE
jgi:hypothetical protein